MKKELFGKYDGKDVYKFTITNGNTVAEIINYGATVVLVKTPDYNGNIVDVVLGYVSLDGYIKNGGYLGAVIGRYANRIPNGEFFINGKKYNVPLNDGKNALHGGINGFDKKVYDFEADGETLILKTKSCDGEQGFPANLSLSVKFCITKENGLKISYKCTADGDTAINLTNHSYFNLNGEGTGDILDHQIFIDADKVTPVKNDLCCYNDFLFVKGTPFDFSLPAKIGKRIDEDNAILNICGGYDINYVLNGNGFRKVASAFSNKTKICMDVFTDMEGMQFYTGNFLSGEKGKSGIYNKRSGFCFETQRFPNAINCDKYPSAILKKGETFFSETEYRFLVKR